MCLHPKSIDPIRPNDVQECKKFSPKIKTGWPIILHLKKAKKQGRFHYPASVPN